MTSALIVIDVQNDFCPGGSLAVPNGDEVVAECNRLIETAERVVLTADWHPMEHKSFASSHAGLHPYDQVEMPYGSQVLWPDHCVQGSTGADFHSDLNTRRASLIQRKGTDPAIDSYSAFFENDRATSTGLHGWLNELGVKHLHLAGLATDFCVLYTALDARRLGYEVTVHRAAVRGIGLDGSMERAIRQYQDAGVGWA